MDIIKLIREQSKKLLLIKKQMTVDGVSYIITIEKEVKGNKNDK